MALIEMVLRVKGYTLLEATDGEEALDITVRDKPDLTIMDIQLPGMNGLEVTRTLRETPALSHIPIIGVTAYAMKGDREKILRLGVTKVLSEECRIDLVRIL